MGRARAIAAASCGVLIALAAGAPAWAQGCSTTCSEYDEGECVEQATTCPNPAPIVPVDRYGAIAYGPKSKAWGYSYRWGSEGKAENVAMQNCAQHGNDCQVEVWFRNQCGAVASGTGTDVFWGLGGSQVLAGNAAMNKCQTGGDGANCELQIASCSN